MKGEHPLDSLRLLCDFLGTVYPWWTIRIRRSIIETNLLKKLTERLVANKLVEKKLLLATIRLLKILVESKDIHTYRYLVNNDLFRHL
jgi:hypothetical protein